MGHVPEESVACHDAQSASILRYLNRRWPNPQIVSPSVLGQSGHEQSAAFLTAIQHLIDDGLIMAEAVMTSRVDEPYAVDALITPRGSRVATGTMAQTA